MHLIDFDEPFGYSVVEAMACGTPVIAYARGSLPELIDAGETGFLVYDVDGRLRFAGGITGSRGHEGDNLGLREVLAIIQGRSTSNTLVNSVYGCPLADPAPRVSEQ